MTDDYRLEDARDKRPNYTLRRVKTALITEKSPWRKACNPLQGDMQPFVTSLPPQAGNGTRRTPSASPVTP